MTPTKTLVERAKEFKDGEDHCADTILTELIERVERLEQALEKCKAQRDFYLKDCRDEFDQVHARKSDWLELENILQGN